MKLEDIKKNIQSPNGHEEITRIRQIQRKLNLDEDRKDWLTLCDNPITSYNGIEIPLIKGKTSRMIHDPKVKRARRVGDKLTNNIINKFAGLSGYENVIPGDPYSVTPEQIQNLAKKLADIENNIEIQALLTREPNRQSSDELTQIAIFQVYLEGGYNGVPINEYVKVEDISNGKMTLHEGTWHYKKAKEIAKSNTTKARSVDFKVTVSLPNKDKIIFYVFAKYTKDAGSGQSHQKKESGYFIDEVVKYYDNPVNKEDSKNIYFIDLLDGPEAEKAIPDHKIHAKKYEDKIFVGNSDDCIKHIRKFV